MKNKILWIALLGLVAFYFFTLRGPDKNRSFSKNIMDLQPTDIHKIEIASLDKEPFQLVKANDIWNIRQGAKDRSADQNAVAGLVNQISTLQAERIISKSKAKWKTYAVDDSSASSMKVTTMSGDVSKLIIGKFDFNQQKKQAKTYVRKGGNDETYLVDGFLRMTMLQDPQSYRNQYIVNITKIDSIRKITYTDHIQGLSMDWERGVTQIKSDSISVSDFLKNIAILKDNKFSDMTPDAEPVYTIEIESTHDSPIQVNAYKHNDQMYLLESSQNPDSYFISLLDGTYKKIFTDFVNIL